MLCNMCVKIVCRWSKLLYCSKVKQVKHEPENGDEVDRERIANGTGNMKPESLNMFS